jgi:hypothetical protein
MASRQDGPSFASRRLNGRAIGQFVIDKEIGKGSFAQVYMGWHKVRFYCFYRREWNSGGGRLEV